MEPPWLHVEQESVRKQSKQKRHQEVKNTKTDHPWRDERGGVVTAVRFAVLLPASAVATVAVHGAADRGRRCGAVPGERPGAPRGAAAVGRGRAAAVGPAAPAHGGHREQHLRAPPHGGLGLGLRVRLGVGVVARGAPRGLGAGRGGARRDAGGGGGLAHAGQRDRELREVVGAAHVSAPAGGDAVRDGGSGSGSGGHLLRFLLCSLTLPLLG